MKLRSVFNLQCYTYEGIEAIREALMATKEKTRSEKFELVFQLIAPPKYKCEVVTTDKKGGSAAVNNAVQIVQ